MLTSEEIERLCKKENREELFSLIGMRRETFDNLIMYDSYRSMLAMGGANGIRKITRVRKDFEDLTGKQFGERTVLKIYGVAERGSGGSYMSHYWLCQCACGNLDLISGGSLKQTSVCQECGTKKANNRNRQTGYHNDNLKHPMYKNWQSIKARCNRMSHHQWHRYGGRGIGYHRDFESFDGFKDCMETEAGAKPSPRHTVERPDNDDWYTYGNLKWAEDEEQRWNREITDPATMANKILGIMADNSYKYLNEIDQRIYVINKYKVYLPLPNEIIPWRETVVLGLDSSQENATQPLGLVPVCQ